MTDQHYRKLILTLFLRQVKEISEFKEAVKSNIIGKNPEFVFDDFITDAQEPVSDDEDDDNMEWLDFDKSINLDNDHNTSDAGSDINLFPV